jgi:hypothetical protein
MNEIKQAFGNTKLNTTRLIITGKKQKDRLVLEIANKDFHLFIKNIKLPFSI